MKLWGGRFKKEESELMEDFNSSLGFDKKLYYEDIIGSIAHVKMLCKSKIISSEESVLIIDGLNGILKDIESGALIIEGNFEDIHSFIEVNLIDRIGNTAKKMHTARSRNDQVALDMRMYSKKKAFEIVKCIEEFQSTIKKLGEDNNVMMPGYTHLQRAQVVTFKHHMMAYYEMLKRDRIRILNALEIMDESPLGCCALAGTIYDIDREYTSKELGFKKPVNNFLDGVSDRDYIIELLSDFSIIMMHLSRLCEELILWSSKEFDYIEIDDQFSTGSSIMPQKKNPDAAELIRGKTGRVYGSLVSLLTTMKALPLAYNKDMQEDKEQFFDAADTIESCLKIITAMLATLKIKDKKMSDSIKTGFLNATELADYLVSKGMAFRDAHRVVGEVVLYCEEQGITIEALKIDELKKFTELFNTDVYEFIEYEKTLKKGVKSIIK